MQPTDNELRTLHKIADNAAGGGGGGPALTLLTTTTLNRPINDPTLEGVTQVADWTTIVVGKQVLIVDASGNRAHYLVVGKGPGTMKGYFQNAIGDSPAATVLLSGASVYLAAEGGVAQGSISGGNGAPDWTPPTPFAIYVQLDSTPANQMWFYNNGAWSL